MRRVLFDDDRGVGVGGEGRALLRRVGGDGARGRHLQFDRRSDARPQRGGAGCCSARCSTKHYLSNAYCIQAAANPASRIAAMPRGLSTIRPSSRNQRVCSDFAVRPGETHTHRITHTQQAASRSRTAAQASQESTHRCPASRPWLPSRSGLPCRAGDGSAKAPARTKASAWAYSGPW